MAPPAQQQQQPPAPAATDAAPSDLARASVESSVALRSCPASACADALQWGPSGVLAVTTQYAIHLIAPRAEKLHPALPVTPLDLIASLAPPAAFKPTYPGDSRRDRATLDRGNDLADRRPHPGDMLPGAWRCARWSPLLPGPAGPVSGSGPAGRARLTGSVLAALDLAGNLVMYAAQGVGAATRYTAIADWTPWLRTHLVDERAQRAAAAGDAITVSPARDAVPVSMAWAPLRNANEVDGPVLALGSMAGRVSLWHLDRNTGLGALLGDWLLRQPSTGTTGGTLVSWVTHLAWSASGSHLAYALSSGEFGAIAIDWPTSSTNGTTAGSNGALRSPRRQRGGCSPSSSATTVDGGSTAVTADLLGVPFPNDPRIVTALTWASPTSVAAAKGATVAVFDVVAATAAECSPFASSLAVSVPAPAMISALAPMPHLADDSTHGGGVAAVTVDGQIGVVDASGVRMAAASRRIRQAFENRHFRSDSSGAGDAEADDDEGADDEDAPARGAPRMLGKVVRYHGACPSSNGIFFAVVYSVHNPSELTYRTDKIDACYLDLLPIPWPDTTGTAAAARLATHATMVPQQLATRAFAWDLALAGTPLLADHGGWPIAKLAQLTTYPGHGPDDKLHDKPDLQVATAGWAAQALRWHVGSRIDHPRLRARSATMAVLRWWNVQMSTLLIATRYDQPALASDLALVKRAEALAAAGLELAVANETDLAILAKSEDSDDNGCRYLKSAADRLATTCVRCIDIMDAADGMDVDGIADLGAAPEMCPACGLAVDVAIDAESGVPIARCSKGHSWARCLLTLLILSSASVRACSGCEVARACPVPTDPPTPLSMTTRLACGAQCPRCSDLFVWNGRTPIATAAAQPEPPEPQPIELPTPAAAGTADSDNDEDVGTPKARATAAKKRKPAAATPSKSTASTPSKPAAASTRKKRVPAHVDSDDDNDDDAGASVSRSPVAARRGRPPRAKVVVASDDDNKDAPEPTPNPDPTPDADGSAPNVRGTPRRGVGRGRGRGRGAAAVATLTGAKIQLPTGGEDPGSPGDTSRSTTPTPRGRARGRPRASRAGARGGAVSDRPADDEEANEEEATPSKRGRGRGRGRGRPRKSTSKTGDE
ncbi:hypothetical protein BC828DRAFT_440827 [Blastocladiella britannica]|nr:hypothetical protein BC828DRAFT_440827 [Blastocladiella britannica]